MLKVIGITGGIASGKSTVSNYLISKGFEVVDCDKLTTQCYFDCFQEIKESFENCIVNDQIVRPLLAKRVFTNEKDKLKLESIIHPYVRNKMQEAIHHKENGLIFLDIPLLFEARMEDLCNEIWVVYVSKYTQLKRLMERNQMDESTATIRIDSQMSIEEKRKKSDIVLDNSTTIEALYKQVDARLEELNEYIS